MLQFKQPQLSDRDRMKQIYRASGFRGSEYTFANLYLWSSNYGDVAEHNGFLTQRLDYQGRRQYVYPAGCCDTREILDTLRADSHRDGYPFVVRSLTRETRARMEQLYPGQFTYEADRDAYDYLYEIETLTTLAGKKYQAKRNHINRFVENHPDWFTVEISEENLDVCRGLFDRWMEGHQGDGGDDKRAMDQAFDLFRALEFEGIILYADRETPVAFSMGNPISEDTFDVNFEKAFADVQGAYPMINREFARYVHDKYPEIRYLNREDDMGVEGLRKAKESYHPIFLEKFIATEIETDA